MKFSLAKLSFLNILIATFLFTISVGFLEVYTSYSHFDKQIQRMQDRYITTKKTQTKYQVNKFVKRLNTEVNSRYKTLEQTLADRVDEMIYVYMHLKDSYPMLSEKELVRDFSTELDSYKTPYNSGYFYIFDKNTIILYHGANKSLEGENLYELLDGSFDLKDVVSRTIRNGKSTGKYLWINPKNNKKECKFAYMQKIPGSELYIATGIYVDKIEKEIKKV